jgi:hypothetical protein
MKRADRNQTPRRDLERAPLTIEDLFPWLRAVEPATPAWPASRDEDDLAAAA